MWAKINNSIKFRATLIVALIGCIFYDILVVIEQSNDTLFIIGTVAWVICSIALIINSLVLYSQISGRKNS